MAHKHTATAGMLAAASAFLLASCGGQEEVAYCVDANNTVVDEDLCDDDRGGGVYFLNVGGHSSGLGAGARLKGGHRFLPSDTAARSQHNIASSGRVVTGTKSAGYGRAGGFGGGGRSGGFGG